MTEVLTALISLVGAALGTFGGIWAGAKLTEYRLAQLEKKVDAHNQFALRMPVVEEQIRTLFHLVNAWEQKEGSR